MQSECTNAVDARPRIVREIEGRIEQGDGLGEARQKVDEKVPKSSADCSRTAVAATSAFTQDCVSLSLAPPWSVWRERPIAPISLGRLTNGIGRSSSPTANAWMESRIVQSSWTTSVCKK